MGNFLVNEKRVVYRNFPFTLFNLDFKLLSFTFYPPHAAHMKTKFPHPQYFVPLTLNFSHSCKTVVTITVLNAELLDLVAKGETKSSEMTGSTHTLNLTFRHRASCIQDSHFATPQRRLFICLINKYISLSDICLTVHH